MTIKIVLGILLITASAASHACKSTLDNKGISPLNSKQANGALNRTLLSLSDSEPGSKKDILDIDCYLHKQAEFFPLLTEIKDSLKPLGEKVLKADTQQDKRAVIKELKRLVTRDAGTGDVQFPGADNTTVSINLFSELICTHCAKETNKTCGEATDLAKKLWLIAGKYRKFADTLNKEDELASR